MGKPTIFDKTLVRKITKKAIKDSTYAYSSYFVHVSFDLTNTMYNSLLYCIPHSKMVTKEARKRWKNAAKGFVTSTQWRKMPKGNNLRKWFNRRIEGLDKRGFNSLRAKIKKNNNLMKNYSRKTDRTLRRALKQRSKNWNKRKRNRN